MTAARIDAHLLEMADGEEPEAVVLDLIGPLRAGRHGAVDGRQAGLNESGRVQRHPETIIGRWPDSRMSSKIARLSEEIFPIRDSQIQNKDSAVRKISGPV